MSEYKLKFKERISRRTSHDLVLMMAKWSFPPMFSQFRTDASVKRYLQRQGGDFEKIVETCRTFKENVLFFENLVGSTWTVSNGARISIVDKMDGETKAEVQGPGTLTVLTYWGHFEEALRSRNRSVESSSYPEYQTAIIKGIASIEAYISHRAEIWSKGNPSDPLLDSPSNKVSFEDKIDIWIPKMSGGKKLDKSIRNWQDFKTLRKIRDHISIHPKATAYGIDFNELANKVNLFRTGIAGILIQLHMLFKEPVPAKIIRSSFSPEVEVIKKENS